MSAQHETAGNISSPDSGIGLSPLSAAIQSSPEGLSQLQGAEASSHQKAPYLPPCRVCSNNASGFHYGVNTCEACKGFFRRSIARKKAYPKCQTGGNCTIRLDGRNACADCRFKKCIEVGMSKTAIKTGRYTHEKRTQDTNEIKGIQIQSVAPKFSDSDDYDRVVMDIVRAYEECFVDNSYCYHHPENLQLRLQRLLSEHNITKVTKILRSPGPGVQDSDSSYHCIQKKYEMLDYIKQMHSSMSGGDDALLANANFVNSTKEMIECWSVQVDKMIRSMVQFAKNVPGFTTLPISDQIILIKTARAEICSLLKYKAIDTDLGCYLDYRTETEDFWVFPLDIHRSLFCVHEDHELLFQRFVHKIKSQSYTIQDASVLAAFCILSPDREELSNPDEVERLRNNLLQVLEHTLKKTHPDDPSILAKTLLLLPMLRALNEYCNKALQIAQERYNPELSPLLKEVFPKARNEPLPEKFHSL